MKIAAFYNLPDGGAKRILYEQLKYLSKRHSIDIFTYKSRKDKLFNFNKVAKNVYEYDFKYSENLKGLSRIVNDYKLLFKLRLIHKRIAYDIHKKQYNIALVHPDIYSESPFLLRYLTTPSIYYSEELLRVAYEKHLQIEGTIPKYKRLYHEYLIVIRKAIDSFNARSSTEIITSSSYMKNQIVRAYEREPKVCYPGVDSSIFNKNSRRRKNLLFIGNKDKIDGYPTLRRILKMANEDIKVDILDFKYGKAKVSNDYQMSKKYSQSICTLCLDRYEPFGLKVLESMACETPVLAVNEGGYKETIIDGVTGFLLPRDPRAFADKIKWLLDYPEEADKMGKRGREHAKDNFSWEAHGKCIEESLYGLFESTLQNALT